MGSFVECEEPDLARVECEEPDLASVEASEDEGPGMLVCDRSDAGESYKGALL